MLLDYNLPDMHGEQLLWRIASREASGVRGCYWPLERERGR